MSEKTDKFNGAIRILTGREEWPIFKEFLITKINFHKDLNSCIPIFSEEDKIKYNLRVGFILALQSILDLEKGIEEADEWDKKMQERIRVAEINNIKRGE